MEFPIEFDPFNKLTIDKAEIKACFNLDPRLQFSGTIHSTLSSSEGNEVELHHPLDLKDQKEIYEIVKRSILRKLDRIKNKLVYSRNDPDFKLDS